MAKKRITELATETTLKDGQYVAIDHTTDGTKKYNIGAELTDLKEDLENEVTAREEADTSINTDLARKANVDGAYDSMTVGNAEQLVSTVFVEDSTPYKFRTTGGSVDVGDREYVDAIVGGTVAWNQLCNGSSVTVQNGHKYYMIKGGTKSIGASTGSAITGLTSGTDIVSDLTLMFGSTIADYIYQLETATAGAGVAWFKKLFPNMDAEYSYLEDPSDETSWVTKKLRDYEAGVLLSVSGLQSHDMVGFNQWDEEWEDGSINALSGLNEDSSSNWRTKNYIPVLPDTTYYLRGIKTGSGVANGRARFYDADKNYIGTHQKNGTDVNFNFPFTSPSNAYYVRLAPPNSGNSGAYTDGVCINLSWDGERNGEYEPYIKHSYALDDSLTLRGIPKLDSANQLYYDGDRYLPSGEVERRYGIVDLGTLIWTRNSSAGFTNRYYATLPTKGKANTQNAFISGYQFELYADADDMTWWISGTAIYMTNGSCNDETAFTSAVNGKHLVYELATPTTETAESYNRTQICDDFGTEEFISDSIVPVGHETKYANNLRAKLEMAPNSPDGDGDYIVRQTNGENTYVPLEIPKELPTAPSTDGSYVLKCTVSGGTPTYTWESES